MVRDLQHVTVYRDPTGAWNTAFPELTRLANGDLLVSFREARYGTPADRRRSQSQRTGVPRLADPVD